MPEDLTRLARELQQETCPRRVIDGAARRIAPETPPPGRLRYVLATALVGLLVVVGLTVQRRLGGGNAGHPAQFAGLHTAGHTQIARQAEGALALIGTVLRDAGEQSGTVISGRAIPPLRNGLQSSWNKIIHQTEL